MKNTISKIVASLAVLVVLFSVSSCEARGQINSANQSSEIPEGWTAEEWQRLQAMGKDGLDVLTPEQLEAADQMPTLPTKPLSEIYFPDGQSLQDFADEHGIDTRK